MLVYWRRTSSDGCVGGNGGEVRDVTVGKSMVRGCRTEGIVGGVCRDRRICGIGAIFFVIDI